MSIYFTKQKTHGLKAITFSVILLHLLMVISMAFQAKNNHVEPKKKQKVVVKTVTLQPRAEVLEVATVEKFVQDEPEKEELVKEELPKEEVLITEVLEPLSFEEFVAVKEEEVVAVKEEVVAVKKEEVVLAALETKVEPQPIQMPIQEPIKKVEPVKKVEPIKKVEPKKIEPKKIEPKKIEPPKKVELKKLEPTKKVELKKVEPIKKPLPKKIEPAKKVEPARKVESKVDSKAKEIREKEIRDNELKRKLLAEAQRNLAKIDSSAVSIIKKNNSVPVGVKPVQLGSLSVDADIAGDTFNIREVSYRNELAGRLKNLLKLPETGEVKIKLTLERSGRFLNLVITSFESQKNRKYIEQTIKSCNFPSFAGSFNNANEYTFSITLK